MAGNCTDNCLIYGVGLNDSNYTVKKAKKVCGKTIVTWECPYYRKWKSMLARCYSKGKGVTYIGVSVCDDWKRI